MKGHVAHVGAGKAGLLHVFHRLPRSMAAGKAAASASS